jgi:hypothetical protein
MRNALAHVSKGQHTVVAAAIRQAFDQPDRTHASEIWRKVAEQVRPRWPKLADLMDESENDVLASSGGKERLGPISKQGNTMLRSFLVLGAIARLRYVRSSARRDGWMSALLARRPYKVAAVAVANKLARIAWALLVKGGIYREAAMR